MTIHKVKSRVRFPSRAKQGGKKNKHHLEKPEQNKTNNDADGSTEAPKVYTFSVESDDPIYDDDSIPVDDEATSFLKKRVLTKDDQEVPLVTDSPDATGSSAEEHGHNPELSDALKSGHPAEPQDSGVPSVPGSLDAPGSIEDENCDPPNSLLMLAPLWSWPKGLFPTGSSPLSQETTADSSAVAEGATADSSSAAADATVDPSQVTEETTVDPSSVAADTTAHSSSVVADGIADLSSAVAGTTTDTLPSAADTAPNSSPATAFITADSSPATTVTTEGSSPVVTVVTADPSPVVTIVAACPSPVVTVTTANPAQVVVVESTAASSLGPWHQWVVKLFAGHKKGQTKSSNPAQTASEPPVSIISWVRERSDSEPEILLPSLPRLELPKVLAETYERDIRSTNRPDYQVHVPRAPDNKALGYVVMDGDVCEATEVQRGFGVANSLRLAPLVQRRNNSDSRLLDRDGDTWAEWNKLNLTAESMPFAKSQSDTNLLHPQSGAEMVRNTKGYKAGQTKGQTGHCFLEDAGHQYPFGQGLGW